VISSAARVDLDLAMRSRKRASSISGRPLPRSSQAILFRRSSIFFDRGTPAMPTRSWESRNLA
jgi:hypothetical protein